jgi:hypothetical protein
MLNNKSRWRQNIERDFVCLRMKKEEREREEDKGSQRETDKERERVT